MPTYQNDGTVTHRIPNASGQVQDVRPGDSVETYDETVPSDFTETSASPTLTKTITTDNVFTDTVKPDGQLNVSVSGTFTGTVTLQRSWDSFVTMKDVEEYTAATETEVDDTDPGVRYRIGVRAGNWTTGTVVVKLSRS